MGNVVITGGNRGLGEGLVHHFLKNGSHVCATVRSESAKNDLLLSTEKVMKNGSSLRVVLWDAEAPHQISPDFAEELLGCEILINNAGFEAEISQPVPIGQNDHTVFSTSTSDMMKAFLVNVEAPRILMALSVPHMLRRRYGRVVNVASARADLNNRVGETNTPAYRLSKAALVSLTKEAAHEFNDVPNVKFNALCPGWCRTRMGGANAPESIEDGVERIVRLCGTSPDDPHGQFFINNAPVR